MNRFFTENSRRFCVLLAAGLIGTLAGCKSNKTQAGATGASDKADSAAPVADVAKAPEKKMGAAPDGTMLPILQTNTRPDGLVIDDLKIGEGKEASPNSTIVIHYHGTLTDGTIFDSTRGKAAARFPLPRLIQGWQQGIPGMKVGGIRRLTVPSELGYGAKGVPQAGIPANATLTFSIQLVDVELPAKAQADR